MGRGIILRHWTEAASRQEGVPTIQKFADIDVFDPELNAQTADEMVSIVKALAPTFGGINLEDIKAPECFEVERRLQEELDIPIFHDDQHGTAIISAAALINAIELTKRDISSLKLVINGWRSSHCLCGAYIALVSTVQYCNVRFTWSHNKIS